MKQSQSAGILLFRIKHQKPDFFLVHPGGPYWKNKDKGVWSVPKGEFAGNELPLAAAIREFSEETGYTPLAPFHPLGTCRLKSGKTIHCWSAEGDLDDNTIISNTILIQWPPGSGKNLEIPEVDRASWFNEEEAIEKIHPAQSVFITRLIDHLKDREHKI